MKKRSALIYACAVYLGGLTQGAWYAHRHNGDWGELGPSGAAIGFAMFALLFVAMVYSYAALARALRDEHPVSAYILSAVVGFPYCFVLWPSHEYLRDRLGLPDMLWLLEAGLLCVVSFEVIRLLDRLFLRLAEDVPPLVSDEFPGDVPP